MKVRGTPSAAVAIPLLAVAALILAALVAVIGSAQAAPQTKVYNASVRVTGGQVDVPAGQHSADTATLRLTLASAGKQTLGSANFDPPDSVTPDNTEAIVMDAASGNPKTGWTAKYEEGVVKFRSSSSAVALKSPQGVFADFSVTVSGCGSALWMTAVRQSNDFSGTGNEATPSALDLMPLGSFALDPIQTIKDGQTIPAIYTDVTYPPPPPTGQKWTATAYDLCGNVKTDYSGAIRSQTFLSGASFTPTSGLLWTNGIGGLTFTPHVTETGNQLTVTDPASGVTEDSNFFDVSDTLCTPQTENCEWKGGQANGITAHSDPPSTPNANLGIGFNSSLSSPPRANFSCNGGSDALGGAVVNINPRGYPTGVPFDVDLTYKKSITGNGPASGFAVCRSHDGTTWETAPACASPPTNTPCIKTQKRTSGGDLLIIFTVTQEDPWGGAK